MKQAVSLRKIEAYIKEKKTLFVILAIVGVYMIGVGFYIVGQSSNIQHAQQVVATQTSTPKALQTSDIDIFSLWKQTNVAREQAGLPVLSLNPLLDNSAMAKCNDMVTKNYWAHNDPEGNEPWHFITDAGISYRSAGENLGEGFDSAEKVFNGWMNSEGHRANILNAGYTDVGFAVCKSDNFHSSGPQLIVVQHFVKL